MAISCGLVVTLQVENCLFAMGDEEKESRERKCSCETLCFVGKSVSFRWEKCNFLEGNE